MATVKFMYRSQKTIGPITLRLLFRHSGQDIVLEGKTRIIVSKSDWELLSGTRRIKDARLKNKKIDLDNETSKLEKLVLEAFSNIPPSAVSKAWLEDLIESHRESLEKGELTESQRQAVIILLEKKGKCKETIKNFRPISLLNVDYKILTKALARRMEQTIKTIIRYDEALLVANRMKKMNTQNGNLPIRDSESYDKDTICYKNLVIFYHLGYSAQEIINNDFLFKLVLNKQELIPLKLLLRF